MKDVSGTDYSTTSVSKGCFVFKKKQGKRRKRLKTASTDEYLYSDLWYVSYKEMWKKIENNLKELRDKSFKKVLEDVINYASNCYNGPEVKFQENVVPIAGLLTGINVPDHTALFDSLKVQLNKQVTPHIAVLRSWECRNVRVTVEKMVSQFLCRKDHEENEDDNDQLTDEDSDNEKSHSPKKVKKALCNFPVLVEWYRTVKEENYFFVGSPAKRNKSKRDNNEYTKPLVVIIPNFENFSQRVLKDFILISSAYVPQLPIVIIVGVATSSLAISRCLPYNVSSRVRIQLFQITSSTATVNNVIENVLFSEDILFRLGSKAFRFLMDIFLFHDFSVQGFIQAYKICMMDHYADRDWFSLCCSHKELDSRVSGLVAEDLEYLRRLPSLRAYVESLPTKQRAPILLDDTCFRDLLKKLIENLRSHLMNFHIALRCLHCFTSSLPTSPLGKTIRELYSLSVSQPVTESAGFRQCVQLLRVQSQQELSTLVASALACLSCQKSQTNHWSSKLELLYSTLERASADLQRVADFESPRKKRNPGEMESPAKRRPPLVMNNFTTPTKARSLSKSPVSTPVRKCGLNSPARKTPLRSPKYGSSAKRDVCSGSAKRANLFESPETSPTKRVVNMLEGNLSRSELKKRLLELKEQQSNDEDAMSKFEAIRQKLLVYLTEDAFPALLQPPTSLPLAEVIFFDDVARVKSRIVGAPRGAIHSALSNPSVYLECDCCKISEPGTILPSMVDLCIAFKLHLESGRFISLADWLQAFAAVANPAEDCDDGDEDSPNSNIDPHIQARFTQAVNELQLLGFIRTTKRKMDHVARLTWGSC
ncbi:origin recognition complex subunit 3 isoform X1 [Schistocerca americana]|uniref:origin recognition complex subunit 3 isoform X1 n=2 Tax=Schistocerca americana TaxID=7009 RepID=UPI001F4F8F34|nr:origin recognition complex subunit 3 isoform X1 [Schistocerca americana]